MATELLLLLRLRGEVFCLRFWWNCLGMKERGHVQLEAGAAWGFYRILRAFVQDGTPGRAIGNDTIMVLLLGDLEF